MTRASDSHWADLEAENERLRSRLEAAEATHRRVEEELRRSQSLLESAQRVAGVGRSWVSEAANDGRLEWSRETYRIFGRDELGFDGRVASFFAMVHPDDLARVSEASRAALVDGTAYRLDHRIVRPDGSVRWVHEEAEVHRDADGRPTRMIGTVQDVTEQKESEERLRQAQKMEAVGRLAGGVAHDFNNVLTAILGYADLLGARVGPQRTGLEPLVQIRSAAQRAASLTRQLLAFSRRQVVTPSVRDLNVVLADLEAMLRRLLGEDVRLVTDLGPEPATVRLDEGQLEQVLLNLVVNARDAMPDGGSLLLQTRLVEAARPADPPGRAPAVHVALTVADTGCGMTAEVKRHLFEPFFTTKPPGRGTGLGLATVYAIVKQADGDILVSSEPGRGSRFVVVLPRVEPGPEAARAPRRARAASRGDETVLLVEDEPAIRAMIEEVLRQQGYAVLAAATGEEALAVHRRVNKIDLLLTDVVMPGMNGRELWERIALDRPGTPVLFVSGYTDDEVLGRGIRSADVAFLPKPFAPVDLCGKVRALIDRVSTGPEDGAAALPGL